MKKQLRESLLLTQQLSELGARPAAARAEGSTSPGATGVEERGLVDAAREGRQAPGSAKELEVGLGKNTSCRGQGSSSGLAS